MNHCDHWTRSCWQKKDFQVQYRSPHIVFVFIITLHSFFWSLGFLFSDWFVWGKKCFDKNYDENNFPTEWTVTIFLTSVPVVVSHKQPTNSLCSCKTMIFCCLPLSFEHTAGFGWEKLIFLVDVSFNPWKPHQWSTFDLFCLSHFIWSLLLLNFNLHWKPDKKWRKYRAEKIFIQTDSGWVCCYKNIFGQKT